MPLPRKKRHIENVNFSLVATQFNYRIAEYIHFPLQFEKIHFYQNYGKEYTKLNPPLNSELPQNIKLYRT